MTFWFLFHVQPLPFLLRCHYLPNSDIFQDTNWNWKVKSELFPVNGTALSSELADLPFKVVENKFAYLGITVTSKHKNLFKENFQSLLNHVKQCLSQWSPLPTSSLPLPSHISIDNLVIKHTLKIWVQFRKHFQLLSFSLLSPVLSNALFRSRFSTSGMAQKGNPILLRFICSKQLCIFWTTMWKVWLTNYPFLQVLAG